MLRNKLIDILLIRPLYHKKISSLLKFYLDFMFLDISSLLFLKMSGVVLLLLKKGSMTK